jgi:putative transposase
MSHYRRSQATGATFFFTLTSYRRRQVLTEPSIRKALREAIHVVRERLPFVVHAWVLLPDHLHCIWELPEDDAAFGLRWSLIKQRVSKACLGAHAMAAERSASQIKRRETGFWQRRFWEHQIHDDCDFTRHMDYIHWNPVKHGYATQAKDWPYSTFHRYVRTGVYPADWGGRNAPVSGVDFGE